MIFAGYSTSDIRWVKGKDRHDWIWFKRAEILLENVPARAVQAIQRRHNNAPPSCWTGELCTANATRQRDFKIKVYMKGAVTISN
jgi:hypothetical protein